MEEGEREGEEKRRFKERERGRWKESEND